MKIPILFEDNHLLLVEKPVNIPVQADASGDLDFLTMLKHDIKHRYQKPGNVYLGLLHRLDRPVGGAMVFAKTSKAAARMSDMLRRRTIDRTYFAIVHGKPSTNAGTLTHYLYKDRKKNQVFSVNANHPEAKKAVLDYQTVMTKNNFSLLKVNLHTGRPHQIRVQLASNGTPLFGDQKYGAHLNKHGQQIALWATKLHFKHPVKKEPLTIYSSPPNQHPWNLFPTVMDES
ncbi:MULTISPECIES: RluA family pseudouridine synthase [unclassified Jeotgalibaca]|uniref:RluA family pseudouridine synthase n=1 Tax=unclassified Jeotgalibaca TaxID=2621505 RepID=UPI003FD45AB9